MGLSEKCEYILFCQGCSQRTGAYQCMTIPGTSRSTGLPCRRGHCGNQSTTCSHAALIGKLAHVTGADQVYLITGWYRRVGIISCYLCINPCTHPTMSSAPPRPTRQRAEALESMLSATSMSNADGASEDRTTRMGRGRCLAMPTATAVPVAEATEPMVSDEAGLLYSSAISRAGSMRSRSRKIQKLVYSLLFAAAGPHGGEDDGRPTSRADAEEYVLLYRYDTKRIWSGNMKRLPSVSV